MNATNLWAGVVVFVVEDHFFIIIRTLVF